MGRASTGSIRGAGTPSNGVIRVSINLRYSKKNEPLLPFDIFCTAPSDMSLSGVYNKTMQSDPDGSMAQYALRVDKTVYVLCENERDNTYASVGSIAAEIAHLRPIRLIFCVSEARKSALRERGRRMIINMRKADGSDGDELLEEDVEMEIRMQWIVKDVWRAVLDAVQLDREIQPVCLATRRPVDGVALRIGLTELVEDVFAIGGKRFVFEVVEKDTGDGDASEEESEDGSEDDGFRDDHHFQRGFQRPSRHLRRDRRHG